MGIVDTIQIVVSLIDTKLKLRDGVSITWDSKYTLGFGTSQSQDSIGEEGKDDRNFLVRVISFL